MCKLKLDQEASRDVLAVGHKVWYDGKIVTITGIRVLHTLDTEKYPGLPSSLRMFKPVCDLANPNGGSWINVPFDELSLWV